MPPGRPTNPGRCRIPPGACRFGCALPGPNTGWSYGAAKGTDDTIVRLVTASQSVYIPPGRYPPDGKSRQVPKALIARRLASDLGEDGVIR